MTLLQKTRTGIFWTSGAQVVNQLFQIIFTAVLARLLAPEDFGLLAMALVLTRLASMVRGLGLGGAVIQNQNTNQIALSSVFWLNVFFALILALTVALLAPLGARFFGEPLLVPIIVVLAANLCFSSFSSIHVSLLTKELNFKWPAIIETTALVVSNAVAIVLALQGWGVWSIVWRLLIHTVVEVMLVWRFSPWRPSLCFNLASVRSLLRYGGYMTLTQVWNFFPRNIDFILIGKFLGAQALGFYTIAFNLAALPGEQIKNVLARVLFPSFSRLQNDTHRISQAYHFALSVTGIVLLPLLVGLGAVAREFVLAVYGEKWAAVIPLLPALVLLGVARGMNHLANAVILAKGHADKILAIIIRQSLVTMVGVGIAVYFADLLLVAAVYTAVQLFFFLYSHHIAALYIETSWRTLWKGQQSALLSCIVMVAGIAVLRPLLTSLSELVMQSLFLQLGLLVGTGALLYVASLLLTVERHEWRYLLSLCGLRMS